MTIKSLRVSKGEMFGSWGIKAVADLTHEMLVKGTWKDQATTGVSCAAQLQPWGRRCDRSRSSLGLAGSPAAALGAPTRARQEPSRGC